MSRLGPFEENTIIVGDCLDIMAQMPDGCVDLVVTDPPYGVTKEPWDRPLKQEELSEMLRVAIGSILAFGPAPPQYHAHILTLRPLPKRMIVWHQPFTKTHSDGLFWAWQPIYAWRPAFNGNLFQDVIRLPYPTKETNPHPARKPPALIRLLIENLSGDLIFDPFIGSGTTAVVADRLGRKFFGCDINNQYVEMALERLRKDRAGRQLSLL